MYNEVKPALISVRPVGIVHFNRVFASRFKRINRHVHVQAQTGLFLPEASVNGLDYVSGTEKTVWRDSLWESSGHKQACRPVTAEVIQSTVQLSHCEPSTSAASCQLNDHVVIHSQPIKRHDLRAHADHTHFNISKLSTKFCLCCHFPWWFVENMATGPIFLQSLNAVWPNAQPAGFQSLKYLRP